MKQHLFVFQEQVFRKSKHPLYFSCDHCLKTYCITCKEEYHRGSTCEQNKTFAIGNGKQQFLNNIGNRANEKRVEIMIGVLGNMNIQFCPNLKCKQPCWKDEDCNAVKCGCGTYFCWLCLYNDIKDGEYEYWRKKKV